MRGLKKRKNMEVTTDQTNRFRGQITLVDAGMVARLEDEESANFIGLLSSLGAGDGRTAAESVLRFSEQNIDGSDESLTAEEKEAFTQDMILLFQKKCKGYGSNVDVGEVLRGVLEVIKNHRVRIDANYATLVVNALCIEGLAKRVCPSYNVLDAAKPLLSSYRSLPFYGNTRSGRKLKSLAMKIVTPILYSKKNKFDNKFFKEIEKKRSRRRKPMSKFLSCCTRSIMIGTSAAAIFALANRWTDDDCDLTDLSKLLENVRKDVAPTLMAAIRKISVRRFGGGRLGEEEEMVPDELTEAAFGFV